MTIELIPALLALLSAALFGLNVHIQRRGLDSVDAMTGAFVSVASMAVVFWLFAPFILHREWWFSTGAMIFAVTGLFFPALGQRLQTSSVLRVGPALTSALGAFTPLFAVVPAVLFLHEDFGWQAALGITLMMTALILSARGQKGVKRNWPLWVLIIPLGAAFVRGIVQPVTKLGLAELPSPFFAALLTSTVSAFVLALMLAAGRKQPRLEERKTGLFWLAASGVINGAGILSLNTAINLGDVLVAAPLASSAPIWALAYGAFWFRNEQLGLRHLVIALLVVSGAAMIILRHT